MKIKDSLKKFRFFHIVIFLSGVVFTVVFNWIVFKDPKRITADGVSTLVGIFAFSLALWSALRVNEWLNNKINDKAFKQAEKILEFLENVSNFIDPLRKQIVDIKKTVEIYGQVSFSTSEKDKIEVNSQRVITYCDQLYMSVLMLKYWNTEISKDGMKYINICIDSLREMAENATNLPTIVDSQNYKNTLEQLSIDYIKSIGAIKIFFELTYDEIFIHNIKPITKKTKQL